MLRRFSFLCGSVGSYALVGRIAAMSVRLQFGKAEQEFFPSFAFFLLTYFYF